MVSYYCEIQAHYWGRHWRRLTKKHIYPSRLDIILRDARHFVACQPTTVPDIWLRNLQFLADDKHRAIVYEMVTEGVNVFHETRFRAVLDAKPYKWQGGRPVSWILSRPVTHYPRCQHECLARPILTWRYDDEYQRANGPPRPETGENSVRTSRVATKAGFVPAILTEDGRVETLVMKTGRLAQSYWSTIMNQIHNWARSGVVQLVGDKREQTERGFDWRDLALCWLSIVVEPNKPRSDFII